MRKLVGLLDPIDTVAVIGIILVLLFVGNRFGADAAIGCLGLVLVGVAVLFAIARGGTNGPTV